MVMAPALVSMRACMLRTTGPGGHEHSPVMHGRWPASVGQPGAEVLIRVGSGGVRWVASGKQLLLVGQLLCRDRWNRDAGKVVAASYAFCLCCERARLAAIAERPRRRSSGKQRDDRQEVLTRCRTRSLATSQRWSESD